MMENNENINKNKSNPLTNNLKIITHNVHSINNNLKRQLWLEYCKEQDINIVSITERKLAESKFKDIELQNSWYKIYIANNNSTNTKR